MWRNGFSGAAGLHQPVPERDERLPVVVARRRSESAVGLRESPALGEPALRSTGLQVAQVDEPHALEHDLASATRLGGLLRGRTLVEDVLFILLQQLFERGSPVVGVLVANAGLLVLDLLQEVGQHHGRRVAVWTEPDVLPPAVGEPHVGRPLRRWLEVLLAVLGQRVTDGLIPLPDAGVRLAVLVDDFRVRGQRVRACGFEQRGHEFRTFLRTVGVGGCGSQVTRRRRRPKASGVYPCVAPGARSVTSGSPARHREPAPHLERLRDQAE
jgi:hypothetical protein